MTPCRETLFSVVPPSNSLVSVSSDASGTTEIFLEIDGRVIFQKFGSKPQGSDFKSFGKNFTRPNARRSWESYSLIFTNIVLMNAQLLRVVIQVKFFPNDLKSLLQRWPNVFWKTMQPSISKIFRAD